MSFQYYEFYRPPHYWRCDFHARCSGLTISRHGLFHRRDASEGIMFYWALLAWPPQKQLCNAYIWSRWYIFTKCNNAALVKGAPLNILSLILITIGIIYLFYFRAFTLIFRAHYRRYRKRTDNEMEIVSAAFIILTIFGGGLLAGHCLSRRTFISPHEYLRFSPPFQYILPPYFIAEQASS